MAKTIRSYTGDGVQTVYPVDFDLGYLDEQSFVYVYLDGNEYTNQIEYRFQGKTQIRLDDPVEVGTVFHIRRVIPRNTPVNDYIDGAILREKELDLSFKQAIMILEEIQDGFMTTEATWAINSNIDMQLHDLLDINVLDAQAISLRGADLETTFGDIVVAKDTAVQSAIDAEISNQSSITAANNSAASAAEAQQTLIDATSTIETVTAQGIVELDSTIQTGTNQLNTLVQENVENVNTGIIAISELNNATQTELNKLSTDTQTELNQLSDELIVGLGVTGKSTIRSVDELIRSVSGVVPTTNLDYGFITEPVDTILDYGTIQ